MTNLPIQCSCGLFGGELVDLSPSAVVHAACYCDDCQAFAQYVEESNRTLDPQGGTEVVHMSPAALRITRGLDHLVCLRLTSRGPLRWYTDCCRTPVASTAPTYRLPWVAFIRACIDADDRILEESVGPVKARVMVRYATGDSSSLDNACDGFPITHTARIAGKIVRWWLHRDQKHTLFFDVETGAPRSAPFLLYE